MHPVGAFYVVVFYNDAPPNSRQPITFVYNVAVQNAGIRRFFASRTGFEASGGAVFA
jgi:hypothetical protein